PRRIGLDPSGADEAHVLREHTIDPREAARRIPALHPRLDGLERPGGVSGAEPRVREEPVPGGVIGPLDHGLRVAAGREGGRGGPARSQGPQRAPRPRGATGPPPAKGPQGCRPSPPASMASNAPAASPARSRAYARSRCPAG